MAEIDLGKVALTEKEILNLMQKSGGAFTGVATAFDNADTSPQIRNICFSDTIPVVIPDGQIVMVYE